jgi:DNA gyrase subunit A
MDRLLDILKAPDFPGGGYILYNREEMRQIYETGSGSVPIRARYNYDKAENCIEITQIPYSTTIEVILKKVADLVKDGKIKDVTDFRDESDLRGLKLTLDLRRGTDPDKLMNKLFKVTTLEDSFKCNFNILVNSSPRQMGVLEILSEWIKFRMTCLSRELNFDLKKKKDKLHLLKGLGRILLDIDKAIKIIRHTEQDEDVIPNLMKGFGIDEIQAEFVAEIKLRNLNKQYIINRIQEIEGLQAEIAKIEEILGDELKLKALIATQLTEVKKKYAQPRKSQLIHADDAPVYVEDNTPENYNVRIYMTREGYFKKITLQSLRGNDEQKLKENDEILFVEDTDNLSDLIFITDRCQLYRAKTSDFDCVKASSMGEFLSAKLNMDEGEKPVFMRVQKGYPAGENFVFIFKNGKGVRVPVSNYETKGNRRKLVGAYSSASPICAVFYEKEKEPFEIMMISSADRAIILKTSLIPQKSTRTSGGVTLMTLKKGQELANALSDFSEKYDSSKGYRKLKIPATGQLLAEEDLKVQQLKIES